MVSELDYPWFASVKLRLEQACTLRPAASMLLAGQQGLGLDNLGRWLAKSLLCHRPQSFASCGLCSSCLLWQAGTHTDFKVLQPAEGKRQIAVDQVREILPFALSSPMVGRMRLIYIADAHLMNQAAANALLKVLEEPPSQCRLLLTSTTPGALLPTIRSRCVRFDLRPPSMPMAEQWLSTALPDTPADARRLLLQHSQQRPLLAQAMHQSWPTQQQLQQQALQFMSGQASLEQWLDAHKAFSMAELLTLWLSWLASWLKRDLGMQDDGAQPWPPVQVAPLMQLYDRLLQDQQGLASGQNWQQQAWLVDFAGRLRRLPSSAS